MKKIILGLACLTFGVAQSLEYEPLFENDQLLVAKIKLDPYEEIGSHRDAYPQVVIGLKGGIISRFEADGRVTEVVFPTDVAVIREADPKDELHKSVNNTSEPIELVVIQLKKARLP